MKSLRALIQDGVGVPFVAIDFETADTGRDSACAVALVRVERHRIVDRKVALIRPPRRHFLFSCLHGITWDAVADKPTFRECWPGLCGFLDGARFLAAHYSAFDRSVLKACCESAGLAVPDLPFLCTVKLARETWRLRPTKLPNVCAHLRIPLRHHDAGSDAEACARIVIEAGMQLRKNAGPGLPAQPL
jgi:DNA polymerase-3 subunit epsilon